MENLVVGIARFVLRLPGCRSLKEKRRVIRRLKDRLYLRRNVSVAEVGAQDEHERAVLALARVGSDAKNVGAGLEKLLNEVENIATVPVVDRDVEVLNYGDSFSLGKDGLPPELPDRW